MAIDQNKLGSLVHDSSLLVGRSVNVGDSEGFPEFGTVSELERLGAPWPIKLGGPRKAEDGFTKGSSLYG